MDLTAAVEVVRAAREQSLQTLAAVLAPAIPHRAVAQLSDNCPHAPFRTYGESPSGGSGSAITAPELAALRSVLPAKGSWQGRATLAGRDVPVVALVSDITPQGALLVLVLTEDTPVPQEHLASAHALWDLLTAHRVALLTEAVTPGTLAVSRTAAAARAVAISELADAHGSALNGLLGVLRDRNLDDTTARTRAVDLAVSALAELRTRAELDQELTEERAGDAFERLAGSLRRTLRARGVRLDLGTPGAEEGAEQLLPADVAHTARAVVQAAVHASLDDQSSKPGGERVQRIHVGWKISTSELRATVRDDGPGTLSRSALDGHRVNERLAPLGGRLDIDAVPGWGTTVTIGIPLAPPDTPRTDPLTALGARELEVLGLLARGRRNRDIAQELHISESTVKFHVKKILDKLGVTSRGEAAALVHHWGAA
ncbi:helix-turn-helix transcriptional regulator [Streptomyces mirabilis]|uniref:helix-turn-helix transcriptional regulator n=1 Tax=Streptomyces mirabilis TaxID=68239 RepID=UPI0033DD5A97